MSRLLMWCAGLFTIIVFITGCTTSKMIERKYLGKTLPSLQWDTLYDSGHNMQKTKHFDIEYDYVVDHNSQTISFSGNMKYNLTADESKYQSETILLKVTMCEIIVMFTDERMRIIDVKGFFAKSFENIFEPIPFEVKIPFKKEYEMVSVTYQVKYQGD